MSKAGRKHYRVAQKEVEANAQCQCYKNRKLIAAAVVILAVTFVKGCVMGYLMGNKSE